jgi:hypothetical protein
VTVLLVDVANTLGSRPDGWWRDRAGAAQRLLAALARVAGQEVPAPGEGGGAVRVGRVVAVLEGRARAAEDPGGGVDVVRADRDGDTAVVEVAQELLAAGLVPLVVTADRGLRERLPQGAGAAGPGWLLALLEE